MGKLYELLHSVIDRLKATEKSIPKKLSELEKDVEFGTKDYDVLENTPIKNVSSDESNMIAICELDSGVYRFSGAFTPYRGSNIYYNFSKKQIVNIITASAGTHVQAFYPDDNTVQFCAIMRDDSAPSGWTIEEKEVCLNDLPALLSAVGSLDGLNTTDKISIVSAINEIYDMSIIMRADIDNLSEGIVDLENKIPTDEHINSLIDEKLGVIENGSY